MAVTPIVVLMRAEVFQSIKDGITEEVLIGEIRYAGPLQSNRRNNMKNTPGCVVKDFLSTNPLPLTRTN